MKELYSRVEDIDQRVSNGSFNPKSREYHLYLRSKKWQRIKRRKLQRANFKCERCNSNLMLQVHHKTYQHVYHEPLEDLIVLCEVCHLDKHDLLTEERIEIEVEKLFSNSYIGRKFNN